MEGECEREQKKEGQKTRRDAKATVGMARPFLHVHEGTSISRATNDISYIPSLHCVQR